MDSRKRKFPIGIDDFGKLIRVVLIDEYDVPLQKAEAGGYYELLIPNREVKYSRKASDLDADAQEALNQIRKNKYDKVFGRHVPDRIVHYGISFCKTDCRVLKE